MDRVVRVVALQSSKTAKPKFKSRLGHGKVYRKIYQNLHCVSFTAKSRQYLNTSLLFNVVFNLK